MKGTLNSPKGYSTKCHNGCLATIDLSSGVYIYMYSTDTTHMYMHIHIHTNVHLMNSCRLLIEPCLNRIGLGHSSKAVMHASK